MGGFDSGDILAGASVDTPDFSASLAAYQGQVQTLSIQIKAANDQLNEVMSELADAKAALQAQYSRKVADLGGAVDALNAQIATLQATSDTLSADIIEKISTRDSISVDNSAERANIAAEWEAVKKSTAELQAAQSSIGLVQSQLSKDLILLGLDKADFATYRDRKNDEFAKQAEEIGKQQAAARAAQDQAAITLIQANDALNKIAAAQLELDGKIMEVKDILAQADAVKKASEDNDAQRTILSTQALQNQQDANSIRVARAALNNKKQELDARQQMLDLAEAQVK